MSTRIIISLSSDMGTALARHWLDSGHRVLGTYRTESDHLRTLERSGAALVHCDLTDDVSIAKAAKKLADEAGPWDALVIAPGTQEPIGPFSDTDIDAWDRSITANFTGQMRILHALLPIRNRGTALGPLVLLFAGGGTNSAPLNSSAYTVSKIALIKMCELLDAEIPDTRFSIVGPGWVKTKIHEATLAAGERTGAGYAETVSRLGANRFTPMERVVKCCDWLIDAPREEIGGRNFSVAHDPWGEEELAAALRADCDMYKLRRFGNDRNFSAKRS